MAGLLAGELYARNRADSVVAKVVECVVQDDASVSFGALPPFLMQHVSGHYTNIHIDTAGNQVREAKGMKVDLNIDDVRLEDTANSSGSVGSLVANISWSSEGIKETVQSAIPLFGGVVNGVIDEPVGRKPSNCRVRSAASPPSPQVVDNGLALEVVNVTGLGFTLPRETVQPALDTFTSQLTKNYPMGIKADSVQVTDTGVVSQFSTQNASIPKSVDDPCFAGLMLARSRRPSSTARVPDSPSRVAPARASRRRRRRCGCRRWP